jgi:hypothetical protein
MSIFVSLLIAWPLLALALALSIGRVTVGRTA